MDQKEIEKPVRISLVILPEARWSVARQWWRLADELGFHTAWTYDHLTWRSFQDDEWFGATTTLAAAATETQRIRIGPLVASPNFRHPVTFAKEVMGLDDLSNGRLSLGLGSGGIGFDAAALGEDPWPMAERTSRFHEFSYQLDTLLSQPASDLTGLHYRAIAARNIPGCIQTPRVPFVISAYGAKGMALTAKLGQGWVTTGGDSGLIGVAEQVQLLDAACSAAGRAPETLDRHYLTGFGADEPWMQSLESFTDLAGRATALGITDIVLHRPRSTEPFLGAAGLLEDIAERFLQP
jgi:alkanesulfonate monooxygenase SsuD/methylene tetrahydromethanopterin reductase-like flavin-dependent oxidoreductase (luciferase family)